MLSRVNRPSRSLAAALVVVLAGQLAIAASSHSHGQLQAWSADATTLTAPEPGPAAESTLQERLDCQGCRSRAGGDGAGPAAPLRSALVHPERVALALPAAPELRDLLRWGALGVRGPPSHS